MTVAVFPDQLQDKPLLRVKPQSKVPVIDNNTPESGDKVGRWAMMGGNAGICLAETELVVVDIDSSEVGKAVAMLLPETFEVKTGSGWYHRYYRCPDWHSRSSQNKELGGGSIRGSGWMAVVPPSTHPSGGSYTVHKDRPITEIATDPLDDLVQEFTDHGGGDHPEGEDRDRDCGDLDQLDELITHDGYRSDIREALSDPRADHNQRQFLVGFLHESVGLSADQILTLIDRHNQWSNYDREITERMVKSVIESAGGVK